MIRALTVATALVARIKELETARLKAMQAGQFEVALTAIREKAFFPA